MKIDRVSLFGDSVARGVILEEGGTYSLIKESFATLAAEKLGIHLDNKARFGCTIQKGMELLKKFLLKRENEARDQSPAVAILEFGGNDCDLNWAEIAANPDSEHFPATSIDSFASVYDSMISILKAKAITPILMTLPPIDPRRYFDWVTRMGIDRGAILKWLGDVQHIYWWHERYNDAVWAAALRNSCRVIDARKSFLEAKDYRDYICGDGIHPNRAGHRLIETAVVAYAAANGVLA